MTVTVLVAVAMAVGAAVLFAVSAVLQNGAVADVVRSGSPAGPVVRTGELRALARTRAWVIGVVLATIGSITHAGALVLAPVAIVQPIGVLAVPFAVVIAARRNRRHPSATVQVIVAACLIAVAGFVTLANTQFRQSTPPSYIGVVAAAVTAVAVTAVLALIALRSTGWQRCVAFATSGATAFGLVSALMRLISLHLTTGIDDLDDVGVWLPAAGVAGALVVGGWAVQQAHASGPPAVVVGCMTVTDPIVAVTLGITMLGEGGATSVEAVLGLVGCAVAGLGAALFLARHHPDAQPAVVRTS